MTSIGPTNTARLLNQVNLNHLLYFWAVGQEGSFTAAALRLGVSQPSVTEQVRTLERRLGASLFVRGPRGVTLTPEGRAAMRFAEEVVGVCSELIRAIPLDPAAQSRPLIVGTADAVPKVIVRTILTPVMKDPAPLRVVCREWRVDHLLSELSLHRLDVVISDAPLDEDSNPAFRSYPAQSSPVDLYATPELTKRARKHKQPALADVPWLLPTEGTSLRTALDRWFSIRRHRPTIAAEAEDRALLHHFAEHGHGIVPVATITAAEVARQFNLTRITTLRDVQERYYVTIMDRNHPHPGVTQLQEHLAADARRPQRATARTRSNLSRV